MSRQAEPLYARTRLDALRRLRGEGYAVVDREGYEQMRAENERFRAALERIAQEPAPGWTVACGNIAKTALTGSRHDPYGVSDRARNDYPERAPGFRLGYYKGWADARAGRQYGEPRPVQG